MKRCFVLSILCVAAALLLPMLFAPTSGPPAPSGLPGEPERPQTGADARETIRLRTAGRVRTLTLSEYLPGVVAAEMPASFAPEALRAQAVAARTYALFQRDNGRGRHPEADLCDDPGCCQAWLSESERRSRWSTEADVWEKTVRAAAADTDGWILTWEGEPILACFHASSAGATESSAALWGRALPYLVSVPSPETAADVPGFVSVVELSAAELRETVTGLAPEATLDAAPENWLGECVRDAAGRVETIRIGGVRLSGEKLRAGCSLRSTAFELTWTGQGFRFTVSGHGHGVGMSQYGADVLARRGYSWREILRHYYSGAGITQMG